MPPRQRFIVPDLTGCISGGTLCNRELIQSLNEHGVSVAVLPLCAALSGLGRHGPGTFWLDSLYLSSFPELFRARGPEQRLALLLHYLPSLVRHGDACEPKDLQHDERVALEQADAIWTPSKFMRDAACRLGARSQTTFTVKPGLSPRVAAPPLNAAALRALVVANLTPGKRVLPLLEALASECTIADRFELAIAGSPTQDADYAAKCARFVAETPALALRVTFLGELSHTELMATMARANVLVSGSHMESYGMALAEARHVGLPIVARSGGNAAAHVAAASGGLLAPDDTALARGVLALARDPAEHERRIAAANRERTPPRPWRKVAEQFLDALTRHLPAAAR